MADRRPRKSDEAIRAAFLRLLFSVPYRTISMSRIAAEADISRSTLYQHYRAREDILAATMAFLIDALAAALAGEAEAESLDPVLRHFWDNRRLARPIFGPPVGTQVCRWLTENVERRLMAAGRDPTAASLAAVPAAAGAIALLERWLTGHIDAVREEIAAAIARSAPA